MISLYYKGCYKQINEELQGSRRAHQQYLKGLKMENTFKGRKCNPQRGQMLPRSRRERQRKPSGNTGLLSMRTLGESTDGAGTKGECVAGKETSMGHCLSNTQESKSCENVALSANNWQWDLEQLPSPCFFSSIIRGTFTLDHSPAECPSQNYINTIITTLRFLFTRLAEA